MRPNCRVVLFVAALFASTSLWAQPAVKTVRVLFIGNSLTYFNDMPSLFASFAEATYPNLDVVTESVTVPGESLKGHWATGAALRKIQEARWDYVVLQDQGGMPLGFFKVDGVRKHERPDDFFEYGERFVSAVLSAKAKPVLYQTYEVKSKSDDLVYLDYAYMTLGRKTGALVAPVARVWHRLHDTQTLDLYDKDGAHPSLHGSYLVAATLVATVFGDVPPAETLQHPAQIPEGEARQILAALRSVRAELAPDGGYANAPIPEFATRPTLESALPILDPLMNGTWNARDNALDLSLGTRLSLSFDDKTPKIELVDFTLNAAFSLPVNDLSVNGNVIRFTTSSQNRTYHLQLARRAEGLEMLVEQPRGKTSTFTHVNYRRHEADDQFEFLAKHFEEISGKATQESFEAALLSYYQALSGRLGAETLSKILMGKSPMDDPWWAILTGWEYKRRDQHDAAIRFLTFATHQFPQSAEAFQNLSEGLEKAGRFEEAYNAALRAEALAPKENPELIAVIQESKARLQKLRPAPPSGS